MLSRKTQTGLALMFAWFAPLVLLLLVVSDPGFAYLMAYAACVGGPIGLTYWWLKRDGR